MKPTEEKRWAMVLAAGLGSRLKQFTADKPKALVEIGGKTLLEHVLENLKRNGFTDVVVNVHHFADKIIEAIQSQSFELNIVVSDERGQLMDT
ncbi:MAG TPA: NTP transferase domain-containing protein, partial [Bacteroidales bacterium]|nr:NTP transferase domain-containing protein [Bacteroidales bacterium]